MDIELKKINLAKRILDLKNESILDKVNDLIDNNEWENVSELEIMAVNEGLRDIEENGTVSNEEVDTEIENLFKNFRSKYK